MRRKRLTAVILTVVTLLSMTVAGCGKEEEKDANAGKINIVNKEINAELGEVEVTHSVANTTALFGKIQTISSLFSDQHSRWSENVPEELVGKSHLRAPLMGKVEAKVTKAGWVYVLTPETGKDNSQQEALEKQGFEVIRTIMTDAQSFGHLDYQQLRNTVLMGKEAKAGDEIHYEAWGVLIAEGTVKHTAPKVDLSKIEKISNRNIVKVNLDLNGQFAFYTNLPDSIECVDDEWERHYYALDGGIYLNGELREDIYIAKVHSGTYIINFSFFDMESKEGTTLRIDATISDGVKAIKLADQTFVFDGMGSWVEQK